jgi:parallel beta-helix repeat protein
MKPRTIFMAVSLAFILTATGLVYVLMLPPAIPPPPPPPPFEQPPTPLQLTPHGNITIDGDANFSDTALLEGWPGDGSHEDPFIIDGLDIDLGGGVGHCIGISNTRVNFTISNCTLTGAILYWAPESMDFGTDEGSGILLNNVTNGELVDNNCNNNTKGIYLYRSDFNTVANNTCSNNGAGIHLRGGYSNTIANNTCSNNGAGIFLWGSDSNTIANNTCNNNEVGIRLWTSDSNTVANNTCSNNGAGIRLWRSDSNTITNNTCNNNEVDISLNESVSNIIINMNFAVVLLLIGFAGIIVLGLGWKLLSGIREFNKT